MNPTLAHHPVVRDFMRLARYTSPYGNEHARFDPILLPDGWTKDPHGNYVYHVPGESSTLFAAHVDTADSHPHRVRYHVTGNFIATDGGSILGADNRAGIAVLRHLIRSGVPGTYMLFVGEEVGMVGSTKAAKDMEEYDYLRVICWDRRGYGSIVSQQMGDITTSPEFVQALIDQYALSGMTMQEDTDGVYTDSYSFVHLIPECTNIGVGYFSAHSKSEMQDAQYLVDIAEASVEVDWENLPAARVPETPVVPTYGVYTWEGGESGKVAGAPWTSRNGGIYKSDIESAIVYNCLTLDLCLDFVFNEPETAARMLYEHLKEL
jgi:hypothetical protein